MRSTTHGWIRRTTTIAAAAAVALALAGCGGSSAKDTDSASDGDDAGDSTTVAGRTINDHGTKNVSGMSKVTLEADDFYFEPSVLTGDPGQQIELTVENEGGTEHNITVPGQAVDEDIEATESITTHVTIPESGVLGFFCEYHESRGMAGGLAVTGASLNGGESTTTKNPSTGRY